jgi:ribonuclease Z
MGANILRLFAVLVCIGAGFTQAAAAQAPEGDALRVTLCGTSGPLPIRDRAKACVAVEAGGALYLVDVGPEATENLMSWRTPLANLRAVFLTHFHSDHIGELGEVNMQSWVAGRKEALPVVGPPGVQRVVEGFNTAYEQDHVYRRDHHEKNGFSFPLSAAKLKAQQVPLPWENAGEARIARAWVNGDVVVTAIEVDHEPVQPAYGYRFDYKGRSVVISGDTARSENLALASKGADVLIHEAQNHAMTAQLVAGLNSLGQPRQASMMADTPDYHATPVEAAQTAVAAGVRALVMTHNTFAGTPLYNDQRFAEGVAETGVADWRLARDGMVVVLPVGGSEIRFEQR